MDLAERLATRRPTRTLSRLPEEEDAPPGQQDDRIVDESSLPQPTQASFSADQAAQAEPGLVKTEAPEPEGEKSAPQGENAAPFIKPEEEEWRVDKWGRTLSPSALYMRFYRGLRSKRDPPPEEVQREIMAAEKDKGGAKLHSLYQHYLACKGVWKNSSLCLTVSTANRKKSDEIYTWLRLSEMEAKYGVELAADLKSRLEEQQAKVERKSPGKYVRKHPDFPDVESMNLYRCFLSMNEIKEREMESKATLDCEASIDQDGALDAM